ncbi:RHS repeat domain-containing protein [Acidovorax sp. LjRoot117]|uniref:RHS repeat domain-containing protein n=1 Tax=Acidovorax sp. LjRoot117 TaxID=3342255 RepID=UPI003ECCB105
MRANSNSLTDRATIYHYLHTDHLATPTLATDKTGSTTWKGASEAFGATTTTIQAIEMNIRFPGQYWDSETGAHYNFHRDYVPSLGRYVQSDPIGLNGGVNEFAYVEGNPLMRKDAYGLFSSGADFALVRHFYGGTGSYMDISEWCGDYVSDAQVEGSIESIKKDIKIQNKKLLGFRGTLQYQIKKNRNLVISPFSIYSFGSGNGHMQDADCIASGDGCCVESKCSLTAKAFDRFTDPVDLCQRWGVCGGFRDLGGVAFNFGLSCSSKYSAKDCKNGCCGN